MKLLIPEVRFTIMCISYELARLEEKAIANHLRWEILLTLLNNSSFRSITDF